MEYIGRATEIKLLMNLADSREAEIAIVYGRRRIGKSSLILHAYKDKTIFSFEGLEKASKKQQLDNFLNQLGDMGQSMCLRANCCGVETIPTVKV